MISRWGEGRGEGELFTVNHDEKLRRIEGRPRASSSYFVPPWNTVFAPGVKPAPIPSPGHQ